MLNATEAEYFMSAMDFLAKINLNKIHKECPHYWVEGYMEGTIIFCNKCNSDAHDLYGLDYVRNKTVKDGNIISIEK